MDELDGRVALVTGAAGGIGSAVSNRLLASGARVVGLDRDGGALRTVTRQAGDSFEPMSVDVTDGPAVQTAIDDIRTRCGHIDILINGAGVLQFGPVSDISADGWDRTFAVNATGVFVVTTAVLKVMRAQHDGAIVTIASNAARVPRADMAAYCASKAAAAMFTQCVGLEVAGSGIRCNVVNPGSTDTAMLDSMRDPEEGLGSIIRGNPSRYKLGIPLAKAATPDEIANAVLFLVSDEASHITLAQLTVDGGATLGA